MSDFTKGVLKKKRKKELKWDAQMNDSKKGHEHQAVPTMYISLNPDILKLLHVNCNIFHQETLTVTISLPAVRNRLTS